MGNGVPRERVIAYIDGFNLYYGLRSKGWRRYYWLNVQALVRRLLKPGQQLTFTRYFTTRVSGTLSDPQKSKRQSTYLEALETLSELDISYGHYLRKPVRCFKCGSHWQVPDEKMTDVNIAVAMLSDAFRNRFDTALMVSGDGDLSGAVSAVRSLFQDKRVVVAFPPNRLSRELRRVAAASFTIGRVKFAASQFPDTVTSTRGYELHRPPSWR